MSASTLSSPQPAHSADPVSVGMAVVEDGLPAVGAELQVQEHVRQVELEAEQQVVQKFTWSEKRRIIVNVDSQVCTHILDSKSSTRSCGGKLIYRT